MKRYELKNAKQDMKLDCPNDAYRGRVNCITKKLNTNEMCRSCKAKLIVFAAEAQRQLSLKINKRKK